LPLFNYAEDDYDLLYASKLDLLMAVNAGEDHTWNGPHSGRPPAGHGGADLRGPPHRPVPG
jgi:hypothetical protein